MKKTLTIIIPFLNEADNIHLLVAELNTFFASISAFDTTIFFVNDGSTDNSIELLKQIKHTSYSAKLISLSKNFGSHAALRAGIQHAKSDLICFIYADLQDPLAIIPKLVEKSLEGNDIVWAVRSDTENSFLEKLFSEFYAFLMKKFAINTYPKKGFDVVLFNSKVQKDINENVEANSSIFLQILTLGYKQATIEYQKKARKIGKSKWTISKKIKLFIDSFVAFSYTPIRFVSLTGIVFFSIGILWTIYIITRKIILNDLEIGWPMLTSILLLGFGITNIGLGILAEYLWRTLDASRKRPVYIIDEIIELK